MQLTTSPRIFKSESCCLLLMDKDELVDIVKRVGSVVDKGYVVVGAGGTSLSLQGVKKQTRDIDFIVERGDIPKLMDAFESVGVTELEVSGPRSGSGL